MVNIKELRIGNYLKCQDDRQHGEVLEICYIGNHGKATINGWEEKEWSPIPLTPDILEKCGLKRHKCGTEGQDMWAGMDGWSMKGGTDWLFRGSGKTLTLVGYFNCQIEYLHQLQNIIFEITGKELEITKIK